MAENARACWRCRRVDDSVRRCPRPVRPSSAVSNEAGAAWREAQWRRLLKSMLSRKSRLCESLEEGGKIGINRRH